MAKTIFRIWRGDARGGEFKEYESEVSEGMVVLDVVHRIQADQANDLAVRWNCKAGKCGSCSAEINGRPRLMCMTRMDTLPKDRPVTLQPMHAFPLLRDLVTNAREKALLELLMAPQRLGLAVVGPPGIPAEVTTLLRDAYLTMVATTEYRDEAIKRGFDVGAPNSGEAITEYVTSTLMTVPTETIAEYRTYVERR